ncbi:TetR/AcrR family transcriptional regulator [Salinifilum ghardaiensis]
MHDSESRDREARRGRRGREEDTRAALLEAARAVFHEHGYDRATVRLIAGRAGVDPAMVNHWFGGKDGLFTAAVALPVNPAEQVSRVLQGDPERIGERIVRRFLTAWDEAGGGAFAALVRSLAGHEQAVAMLREFLQTALFEQVTTWLGADRPELRAALCATQMIGLGMARYVLRLDPLATAGHDAVVASIAPNLQRYLTGELPAETVAGTSANAPE